MRYINKHIFTDRGASHLCFATAPFISVDIFVIGDFRVTIIMSDNVSVISNASSISKLRLCECKRRIPSIDLHSVCERCRPFKCSMDRRCSTCSTWSDAYMTKYIKRMAFQHQEENSKRTSSRLASRDSSHPPQSPSPPPAPQVAIVNHPIVGYASRVQKQNKGKTVPVSSDNVSSLQYETDVNLEERFTSFEAKIDRKFDEQKSRDIALRQSERDELIKLVSDTVKKSINNTSRQVSPPNSV